MEEISGGSRRAYLLAGAGIGIGVVILVAFAIGPAIGAWNVPWMGGGMMGHGGMMRGGGCCMHGGGGGPSSGAAANATTVDMRSSTFDPVEIRVPVGATVTWVNRDGYAHTVTSDSGRELDSGDIGGGASWSHTFAKAGRYAYHCVPHSYRQVDGTYAGMVGVVVVGA